MDAVLHLILQAGDVWGSAPWYVAEEVMFACFGDMCGVGEVMREGVGFNTREEQEEVVVALC